MLTAFSLAIALAMDAFAVALTQGARFRHDWKSVALIAMAFGLFQGLMPLAGWLLGSLALPFVEAWDHWIAGGLLAALGLQMIWSCGNESEGPDRLSGFALLAASIATSVDAFAAGIILPTMDFPPLASCALIATVTAALSAIAIELGQRAGDKFGRHAEIAGGVMLIALGANIVFDHTIGA
ncbi:manganese efflux pump MntP family protein [Altererythrobacter sp.]|uniref:manganese efflux pump MntP n=1 Tax=Altererythrobacter sp. TaxID=1872480 RepID=UPI001B12D966|nr:manganese efflux pump MntP family protein [Altererythrobacter sp.]MBO6610096.1 manganese efflux pump [Altererythrobacter sp.]MBO6642722.1 manganese efflux pump [Altererythrobacter sp.]MBO6708770.1 manganese efflux pump [Altererythrobacter sp.]